MLSATSHNVLDWIDLLVGIVDLGGWEVVFAALIAALSFALVRHLRWRRPSERGSTIANQHGTRRSHFSAQFSLAASGSWNVPSPHACNSVREDAATRDDNTIRPQEPASSTPTETQMASIHGRPAFPVGRIPSQSDRQLSKIIPITPIPNLARHRGSRQSNFPTGMQMPLTGLEDEHWSQGTLE